MEDLSELPIEQLLTRPIQLITVEKATIEQKHYDADCISVRLEEINILDFGMKKEDRLEILEKGKEAVQQYKKQSRVKRRNSF